MGFHQRLADVQAEAQARDLIRRGGDTIKLVEDPWERVGRDSHSLVRDADPDRRGEILDPHHDLAARRRVLDGVPEQVGEDLGQPAAIPATFDRLPRDLEADQVSGTKKLRLLDRCACQVYQIRRATLEARLRAAGA